MPTGLNYFAMRTASRENLIPRAAVAPVAMFLVLLLAAPAAAERGLLRSLNITEPASHGLSVTGPLRNLTAASKARVVVPTTWRRLSAPSGRLRFATTQNPSCHYNLTYSVRSTLAPPGNAANYVAARLAAPSARHLLDSGERGNRAFRVVRQRGAGSPVRLDALWAGVLTKRADIAPSGQVAWTEVRVSAVSRTGDKCHAGTWRSTLGPAIGDSLAVAHTTLRFARHG